MAKRGLIGELMHQAQVSAQQRERAAMASAKAQVAAERAMERAQKAVGNLLEFAEQPDAVGFFQSRKY